jgi:putative NADPH-quinone reductase|tara:strand:+ start:1010 stop:1528 length:519 start_codon:yes stop_codon:yes gene_type:complete
MKKLVIVTHPDLKTSNINKTWINELKKHPNDFEIHSLYDKYPNLNFDIAQEQALLESYDEIIFQFPLHWFSTPYALKKYIDDVFTYGWAFGPEGDKLKGKKIGLAVSTGGIKDSYTPPQGITLKDLLNDVTLSFVYCGCELGYIHIFHGAMYEPQEADVIANSKEYVSAFID